MANWLARGDDLTFMPLGVGEQMHFALQYSQANINSSLVTWVRDHTPDSLWLELEFEKSVFKVTPLLLVSTLVS